MPLATRGMPPSAGSASGAPLPHVRQRRTTLLPPLRRGGGEGGDFSGVFRAGSRAPLLQLVPAVAGDADFGRLLRGDAMQWPAGWVESEQVLGWAELGAVVSIALALLLFAFSGAARHRVVRRRRFWCALSRRDVEVEFAARGLPGFRRVAVRSCSQFEPPTAVACRRACVDVAFRRRWEPSLRLSANDGQASS